MVYDLTLCKNETSKDLKCSIPQVQVNEIFHEITKLDANKSSGTDNIGPRILKIIVIPLTYIFNRIIDTGIYPSI
jgi:hypothetical protein